MVSWLALGNAKVAGGSAEVAGGGLLGKQSKNGNVIDKVSD